MHRGSLALGLRYLRLAAARRVSIFSGTGGSSLRGILRRPVRDFNGAAMILAIALGASVRLIWLVHEKSLSSARSADFILNCG